MITGNAPAMRFEQDGTGGFTPQKWDLGANEANFFLRDATAGSRLPLRVRPGAPTSSIDIAASGNVGFGTASPQQALHVQRGNADAIVRIEQTAGAVPLRHGTSRTIPPPDASPSAMLPGSAQGCPSRSRPAQRTTCSGSACSGSTRSTSTGTFSSPAPSRPTTFSDHPRSGVEIDRRACELHVGEPPFAGGCASAGG